ncbi:MAG: hypothetical protein MjAS7_1670 [Metallosphaera javensis (ex Sakai et al. 2022)]|nr:MAG: hypothetical protein MjAS7_1670 [Metallosphaera javensis (ex Sakai et al. 2022)]
MDKNFHKVLVKVLPVSPKDKVNLPVKVNYRIKLNCYASYELLQDLALNNEAGCPSSTYTTLPQLEREWFFPFAN